VRECVSNAKSAAGTLREEGEGDGRFVGVDASLPALALGHCADQPGAHTLQPTELVHEAGERLARCPTGTPADREHVAAVVLRAMRQFVVDHARCKAAVKRGGGGQRPGRVRCWLHARRVPEGRWLVVVRLLAVMLAAAATMASTGGCRREAGTAAAAANANAGPRVVALGPGLTDMLRSLGMGGKLVGRHGFDAWADAALPVCGDQTGLNFENLLRVRPTHVYVQWGQRTLPPALVDLAEREGWRLHNVPLLTLADVRAAAELMHGELAGGEFASTAFAKRWDAAFAAEGRPGLAGAGRVLLLHTVNPPAALGPGSYHHDTLVALGGRPALTTGGAYQTLDAEAVLRLAPDAVVLVQPAAAGGAGAGQNAADEVVVGAGAAAHLGPLAGLAIPALAGGSEPGVPPRVARFTGSMTLIPGPSLAGFAEQLRGVLRGWAGVGGHR